jgi:hypothetical protein
MIRIISLMATILLAGCVCRGKCCREDSTPPPKLTTAVLLQKGFSRSTDNGYEIHSVTLDQTCKLLCISPSAITPALSNPPPPPPPTLEVVRDDFYAVLKPIEFDGMPGGSPTSMGSEQQYNVWITLEPHYSSSQLKK